MLNNARILAILKYLRIIFLIEKGKMICCAKCGSRMPKGAHFCGVCGAEIARAQPIKTGRTRPSTAADRKNKRKALSDIIPKIPRIRQEGKGKSGWGGNPSCEAYARG